MSKRIEVDVDVVDTQVAIDVEAGRTLTSSGPRPKVRAHVEGTAEAYAAGAECLCMTPAQAERLGRALLAAAKAAREMR